MKAYLDLLLDVMNNGVVKNDRTGTGTRSVFGRQLRFNLADGFPLLTTKKLHTRSIFAELLWMIAGDTNNNTLRDQGVTIWDEWARPDGSLGPIYGAQWRRWDAGYSREADEHQYVDQLWQALDLLNRDPDSRRIIISAWNPADLPEMALAPCHCLFQFNTRPMDLEERCRLYEKREGLGKVKRGGTDEAAKDFLDDASIPKRYLDCQLYQRSADALLGLPFNLASYALLTHLVARDVGMVPGEFIHTFGDLHLYSNHIEQATAQLRRVPNGLPELRFSEDAPTNIFDVRLEHIQVTGYDPHPAIAAPVAV